MSLSDRTKRVLRSGLADKYGSLETAANLDAKPIATYVKAAADGAAATATAEVPIGTVPEGSNVGALTVEFVPAAALVADANNYATLLVQKRTAGGAAVTVASITTKPTANGGSGNWTAWVPVTVTVDATKLPLADGDVLTFSIAKSGTGVVVPIGMLCVL